MVHTLGEAERKRDKCGMAQRATGKVQRAAQRTEWKAPFSCRRDRSPASVIVMRAWLALAGVLPGGICLQMVLPAIAPSGKGRARRFEDRKNVTAGNSRRCRFTSTASCIRRHFRLPNEDEKKKMDETDLSVLHKHIKEVPTTMAVSLGDIMVVVGFSSLVPFLKWACAHQAGSRFQNRVTAKSIKNR